MFYFSFSWSQEIEIYCENEPVNKIFLDLRDKYGLQCSFNDNELSKFKLTINKSFSSLEESVAYILSDIPFAYEKQNDVFLILPDITPRKYILNGKIIDKFSEEALPYSHLIINDKGMVTDFKGGFSFTSIDDSIFNVKASYLGYYILDTVLMPGENINLTLSPSSIEMKEVVIEGNEVENTVQVGSEPGLLRLNNKMGYVMPGNGDNPVFNLLRLQPGILASGEQTNDIIIWGSGEGQSQVKFDGYTIYGLKNFNDNISTVNPFLAKDIQILKGGYSAEFGGRVGGIVNITGIDGNKNKPDVTLSANNMTLNAIASVPVFDNSAFVIAYRQTYYNIYDSLKIIQEIRQNKNSKYHYGAGNSSDVSVVYPDYSFKDLNLKYSGNTNGGDNYYFNFLRSWDSFSYSFNEGYNQSSVESSRSEDNNQFGTSAFYGKHWGDGTISNFTVGYSGLETDYTQNNVINNSQGWEDSYSIRTNEKSVTSLQELNARVDNIFAFHKNQVIEAGIGFVQDDIELQNDSSEITKNSQKSDVNILNAYIKDNIHINSNVKINLGLRVDYPIELNKTYFQPRISVSSRIFTFSKVYSSWGVYNQFISLNPVFDSIGNYNYFWSVSDIDKIPVLKSNHFVVGYLFNKNDLTISLEGFLKNTSGVAIIEQNYSDLRNVYHGDSKSKGLDFFIKKEYKGHTAWVSYTLSETKERFPITVSNRRTNLFHSSNTYIPALYDQRHELKLAALANFKPFYVTANYVYGSGFPKIEPGNFDRSERENPYNRFDVAFFYRLIQGKVHLQAGISILNVFNTDNIKYSSFLNLPSGQTSYVNVQAESIPFTPLLNLSISF